MLKKPILEKSSFSVSVTFITPIAPGTLYLEGTQLIFGAYVEHSRQGKHLISLCHYATSQLGNRTHHSCAP